MSQGLFRFREQYERARGASAGRQKRLVIRITVAARVLRDGG
jgi:hypothetical protein